MADKDALAEQDDDLAEEQEVGEPQGYAPEAPPIPVTDLEQLSKDIAETWSDRPPDAPATTPIPELLQNQAPEDEDAVTTPDDANP